MNKLFFGIQDQYEIDHKDELLKMDDIINKKSIYKETRINDLPYGGNFRKKFNLYNSEKTVYKNIKILGVDLENIEIVFLNNAGCRINFFEYSFYEYFYKYKKGDKIIVPFKFIIPTIHHLCEIEIILKNENCDIKLEYDVYNNELLHKDFEGIYMIEQFQFSRDKNIYKTFRLNFNQCVTKFIIKLPDENFKI